MLVDADPDILRRDVIEAGELLVPCTDGIYMLPVQVQPVRWQGAECGCQFVDMPPRERGILHFYADSVMRGEPVSVDDLEKAGKITVPTDAPPESILEPDEPQKKRFKLTPWMRRGLVVAGLLLAMLGVALVWMPGLLDGLKARALSRSDFVLEARTRLLTEKAAMASLDERIRNVNELLGSGMRDGERLANQQVRLLQGGLKRLEQERDVVQKRIAFMEDEIESAAGSRFFLPKAFTNPNWAERPDPAPFLTKMLQDLGFIDQLGKEKPAELDKYLIVAEARVKQAETALESTRVRRETLEKMLKRVDDAGPKAGFPQNQIDLMRRDVSLMKLEEDRLTETLKVLNDNVNAVKSGNLIYESKLLQRFDAEPTRSLGTTPESTLLD
ncbi:MAG: hypothetical protein BGO12_17630 [Verrucomicrobia bacterium 61-8]|nr:MAG: hypothetical protein BGO12_17630 [Verrucomicrobia bacterium 61-8]